MSLWERLNLNLIRIIKYFENYLQSLNKVLLNTLVQFAVLTYIIFITYCNVVFFFETQIFISIETQCIKSIKSCLKRKISLVRSLNYKLFLSSFNEQIKPNKLIKPKTNKQTSWNEFYNQSNIPLRYKKNRIKTYLYQKKLFLFVTCNALQGGGNYLF